MPDHETPADEIRARLDHLTQVAGFARVSDVDFHAALALRTKPLHVTQADIERHLPDGLTYDAASPQQRLRACIAARAESRGRPLSAIEQLVNMAAAMSQWEMIEAS